MMNTNNNGGFVALITALMVSAGLMLFALSASQAVAGLFDEINRKQYRISATEAALACLNQVFIELEHDYFYNVDPNHAAIAYPDLRCSILSVVSANSSAINDPAALRAVAVKGYSGVSSTTPGSITATVSAQVLISSQNISLVSEMTGF
jgi:hypothetical protein